VARGRRRRRARALPPDRGHPQLAAHIGQSLMADEFDMSFFQERPLDHGCFSPLSMLCAHEPAWPARLIPLQMACLQFPVPSARRFFKLGQALRAAIESYPRPRGRDRRHRRPLAPGARRARGFNNPGVGHALPRSLRARSERLAGMTLAEYATLGGFEGCRSR
jgi:gallate dioxygenase